MFRIIRALVLVVALVAILVASSPTPVLTNARAIQEGKPLLRPRAVPQCKWQHRHHAATQLLGSYP